MFIGHLICTMFCSKFFISIISFHLLNSLNRYNYDPNFTDKETEAQ